MIRRITPIISYTRRRLPQRVTSRIPRCRHHRQHRCQCRHCCPCWCPRWCHCCRSPTICQIARMISTHADGFQSGSRVGYLVDVLVVGVIVIVGRFVALLRVFLTHADRFQYVGGGFRAPRVPHVVHRLGLVAQRRLRLARRMATVGGCSGVWGLGTGTP